MSSRPSIGVVGDHVECLQCTCMPPKAECKEVAIVEGLSNEKGLQNWEKWIQRRKKIHEHLTKSLDRPAGDLLMNLNEECRRIQEEKLIFEYCRINTQFDKYRGNPAFWKVPPGLPERSDRLSNPVYFANMTKVEQNEVPVIEHVDTPNYILSEKGIFPRNRKLYTTRQTEKYRNIETLSSKINKIEPHKPACGDLVIVGEKLQPPKESSHSLENQDLEGFKNIEKELTVVEEEKQAGPRISFTINETVVHEYNQLETSVTKIRVLFEGSTHLKTALVKYLKFKNEGSAAVRFYWNRVEKFLLFRDLIKCDREESHSFYFNKNEILLPPGKTIHFPIWFKSNEIGNYFEIWELTTKPKMWDDNIKLIVNLQGFVYPDNFDEKSKFVKDMLATRVSNTAIRNILQDILVHLKFTESDEGIFYFTEKELFESANQEFWGVEKRPKYLYDRDAVDDLKQLYKEVRLSHSPKLWNYSIRELRMAARRKDIWVYVENETKEMLRVKQRRMELSGAYLPDYTGSAVAVINKEFSKDAPLNTEPYSRRLDSILRRLEQPSVVPNTERLKYFTVYSVMRNFAYRICEALEKYDCPSISPSEDCNPSYDYKSVTLIEEMPDRLIFERFDDIWTDRTKRDPAEVASEFQAYPKPEVLRDIPIENSRMVYNLYFNVVDADEEEAENGLNEKEEEIEKIREQEKVPKPKETNLEQMLVKEGFDPFQEEYISGPTPEDSITRVSFSFFTRQPDFDYHKYVTVFTYLSEAIDTMVDALETFKENTIDVDVLEDLTKCNDHGDQDSLSLSGNLFAIIGEEIYVEDAPKLEDDPYFQNLLDSHLNKNLYTREYIIEGTRKTSRADNGQPQNFQEISESGSLESWIFKSHETLAETVKSTASAGAQTSQTSGNFKITNELLNTESALPSTSSTISEKPSDTFYVLDEKGC